MGSFSQVKDRLRLPLPICASPRLYDHRVMDRPVLPAAHALGLLAAAAQEPTGLSGCHSREATFESFLPLPEKPGTIQAFLEILEESDGSFLVSLLTKIASKRSAITRLKPHLHVRFCSPPTGPPPPPPAASLVLAEPAFPVKPGPLYRDLVPFGPAFRNLSCDVRLTPAGVAAVITAPPGPPACPALGCPFVFDAALHAVNVWTQRYRGMVTFPVGYAQRCVPEPTREGEEYVCRAVPLAASAGTQSFDIWLLDREDRVRETVLGVEMRELFPGLLQPPAWIVEKKTG